MLINLIGPAVEPNLSHMQWGGGNLVPPIPPPGQRQPTHQPPVPSHEVADLQLPMQQREQPHPARPQPELRKHEQESFVGMHKPVRIASPDAS